MDRGAENSQQTLLVRINLRVCVMFVIQFFDTIYIVRFLLSLEIGLSFGDYLFISAKFLSSKHSFGGLQTEKVTDLENTVDAEAIRSLIHAICRRFD
jgi:hypothetical protein